MGCFSYKLYWLFQTQHSFGVTIFTFGFRLFFILLQINFFFSTFCTCPDGRCERCEWGWWQYWRSIGFLRDPPTQLDPRYLVPDTDRTRKSWNQWDTNNLGTCVLQGTNIGKVENSQSVFSRLCTGDIHCTVNRHLTVLELQKDFNECNNTYKRHIKMNGPISNISIIKRESPYRSCDTLGYVCGHVGFCVIVSWWTVRSPSHTLLFSSQEKTKYA